MKRSDENRLEAFEMKAPRQILRVSWTDKLVGLGTGRCQQKFTSNSEKQEVEILRSHHER